MTLTSGDPSLAEIDPPPAAGATGSSPAAGPSGDVQQTLSDITTASRNEGAGRYLFRTSLLVVAVAAIALVLQVTVLSGLEYRAAQNRDFNTLRKQLAASTAPCPGCLAPYGGIQPATAIASGSPIAILDIPLLHLHEVVVEGTSSEDLTAGPGHLRDTVLPGEAGTSVILGRRAAYGAPFGRLHDLRPGAKVKVTSALGTSTFQVIDVRQARDIEPPAPGANAGRLILVTSTGAPFVPSGVLYIDADLVGPAKAAPALAVTSVPSDERPMGLDTGTLWALAFFLEAMMVLLVGAVWCWRHWGHAQTWIVFVPLTAIVGYYVADQVTRLLPNLL